MLTQAWSRTHVAPPAASDVRVEHAGPTVVTALRDVARLESATLLVEKVIDVRDHQTHWRGLLAADDALLFVARGEVVLGVDLQKLGTGDLRYDEATRTAYMTLPQPEVFSTRFDEASSYVHSRATDVLAQRNEALEARARREASVAFAAAGRTEDALERARSSATAQLRRLALAAGAREVIIAWQAPPGELAITN